MFRILCSALLALVSVHALAAEAPEEEGSAVEADLHVDETPFKRMYHGFRVGYTFVGGTPTGTAGDGGGPISEPGDLGPTLRSSHLFVIGYELTQRYEGGSWLNVITVQNVSVSGINQSLFIPSLNALVGFEIKEQIQIGTGINLMPFDPAGKYVHQILAVGWTPPAGKMNFPVHLTFIPDNDGNFRLGGTVGVNW